MAYGRILLDDLHCFYGNGTAFGLGSLAAAGKKQGCTQQSCRQGSRNQSFSIHSIHI